VRASIVLLASISCVAVLTVFLLAGNYIFSFFGITVPAFQIAGGILFVAMAFRTLEEDDEELPGKKPVRGDPSIVLLGIPLIAGPGAISTVMVLMGQAQDGMRRAAIATAIVVNLLLTFLILVAAPAITARIGETGQKIVAKIMGLISTVIGVQFIMNGVKTVLVEILKSAR
jgi:multiple antibiotic resistance protein